MKWLVHKWIWRIVRQLPDMTATIKHSPYYLPVEKEVEIFNHLHKNRLPLLLQGPTGCGKSRFVEYMAHSLSLELITVSCHDETSAIDLLGRYIVQGAETIWQDGPLTRAVRKGALIYIDEIAEARPDTIVVLHSLTDHRRTLFLDRKEETIEAPNSFMVIASYNPGYQKGWKELKPSTRQRFVSLSFNYPAPEVEAEILTKETGIDAGNAKKLVQLGNKIRSVKDLNLPETASTRLLVNAGKLIQSGLPSRLACEISIAETLSDEAEIIRSLKDLIAMIF